MDIKNDWGYYDDSAESSLRDTEAFIQYIMKDLENGILYEKGLLFPVITPRFLPSCSENLLKGLGELASKYNLPIQSHISESKDVMKICSLLRDAYQGSTRDLEVFHRCSLLTKKTVLAHGVHLNSNERAILSENGSSIAHCPLSNIYFANGVLPVRKCLEEGVKIGLGTDVAGGYSPTMLSAMRHTVLSSTMLTEGVTNYIHHDEENLGIEGKNNEKDHHERISATSSTESEENEMKARKTKHDNNTTNTPVKNTMKANTNLTHQVIDYKEAFYLATLGGAQCLGMESTIGSLEPKKAADFLILNVKEGGALHIDEFQDSLEDKIQKFFNLGDDRHVKHVFVQGKQIK